MRLLRFGSSGELCTEDFVDRVPKYAILSHTWAADDEEVTFKDLQDRSAKDKPGYGKIRFCGKQAQTDGLSYFWVDTCCIDKTNQVELTEAITSMFRWYRDAAKCYVYLADVTVSKRGHEGADRPWISNFRNSRWFTRGWTLQELLAPKSVDFYSREGKLLGDKVTLQQDIHQVTRIPIAALRGAPLSDFTSQERMNWVAKRNTKRPEDKWYCLQGIFDVYMPPMYGEKENALIRLVDEIGRSSARRLHMAGRELYSASSSQINQIHCCMQNVDTGDVDSIQQHRKKLLESMSFDQMDERRATIKSAHFTTCAWLLKHTAYIDWVDPTKFDQHCGLLWIKGKPGAGKSTLLKYVHANAARHKSEREILFSFFFNARGDELERSTTGAYRALLFYLLNKAPDLQEILDELYPTPVHQAEDPIWTVEKLQKLLASAITKLGQRRRRLKCFIDALDECDEQQVREMIFLFEQLGQLALNNGSQLHVCFASRHYPAIEIRSARQLILEHEPEHDRDLAEYVRSHLRTGGDGRQVEKIRAQIQKKANGIFMWAVLVIPILNKEFLTGRIFAVQRRLQEIPTELSQLFKHILRRDTENMEEFLLCLRWILFARRGLSREEFYYAMVAGLDPSDENLSEWDPETITEEQMESFVRSSSKGLAELTKSLTPVVHFIHESVKDFLIGDGGLCELWPELQGGLHSSSHNELKRCCLNYLTVGSNQGAFKFFRDTSTGRQQCSMRFPFLEYASLFILKHTDEAAREIPQGNFVASFAHDIWIDVAKSDYFKDHQIHSHAPYDGLLYVAAERNLPRLIKTLYHLGSAPDMQGGRYHYPLFAALIGGHRETIKELLQPCQNALFKDAMAEIDFAGGFHISRGQTPLLWALERGYHALAKILVKLSGRCLNAKNSYGSNAVFLTADAGNQDVLAVLLEAEADINARGHYGTALLAASNHGRETIVRMLLEAGVEVDAQAGLYHSTALYAASQHGHDKTVQMLLEAGANVNTPGVYGTALYIASKQGHEMTAQILLDAGADTKIRGDCGTALYIASKQGHETIVQILLKAGADVNTRGDYGSALYIASEQGHEKTVQTLLHAGADTNLHSVFRTTLGVTSKQSHEKVLQTLLPDAGVDADIQGDYGTALYVASERGHEKIVRMLLDAGADANIHGISRTALSMASGIGHREIVQMLLEAEAEVNTRGRFFGTALRAASTSGHKRIVKALLEAGAEVNAQGGRYSTALCVVSRHDDKKVVKMLSETRAEVNAEADVNAEEDFGDTALHMASAGDHNTSIQTLLDAGTRSGDP